MKNDFSFETDTDRRRTLDAGRETEARKTADASLAVEKRSMSAAEYSDAVENILQTKKYQHWESDAAREQNRNRIENYDEKKRAVDKASLQTQSSILREHGRRFDRDNLARIQGELGSNKIEIYNERTFVTEKDPSFGSYNILGMRDVQDGKICVRDSEDVDTLRHVSTHETMHDLSFQSADSKVSSYTDHDGHTVTETETRLTSGLHQIEKNEKMIDGTSDTSEIRQFNRYLNEGYTELYTIEQMQKRGEYPSFDSYTDEVGWAMAVREKVGEDVVADAYFGGDLSGIAERVNGMSDVPDAWGELNRNIDAFHYTRDLKYKKAADDLIDGLREPKITERGQ